ncbi:UNKNOWN [Stylonychia lemnae]|uniref:Ankyrin repeat protein n=1 Tax=Stylonychia lemnae TaxID=5949 RepID=A0A078B5K3_STYLE|nr:UNKNOWN [Stylonychia lemnae]|eukprot:CDW88582.1 UNKNOWN [Stylonychia lemnae]
MGQCVSQNNNKSKLREQKINQQYKPEKPPADLVEKRSQQEIKEDNFNSKQSLQQEEQQTMKKKNNDLQVYQHHELVDDEPNEIDINDDKVQNEAIEEIKLIPPKCFHSSHLINEKEVVDIEKLINEYEKKPILLEFERQRLVAAVLENKSQQVLEIITNYKIDVMSVTGQMESVQVGNKKIQSEHLNILHLAAYYGFLDTIKVLCENIPSLDLAYAGKIPSSSGLANQSELSMHEYESSRINIRASNLSVDQPILSDRHDSGKLENQNYRVRSLILFWALDKNYYEILSYLWNFDKFGQTNWGIKNLEFMLILANDMKDSRVFDILLSAKPFSLALQNLTFGMAMDFIEDHIVRSGFVSEQQKLKLIYSEEMAPYSFIGALIHYSIISNQEESNTNGQAADNATKEAINQEKSDFDRQVDECEEDIEIEELSDLYNKLKPSDVKFILGSQEIVEKLQEIYENINQLKRMQGDNKKNFQQMIYFILNYNSTHFANRY